MGEKIRGRRWLTESYMKERGRLLLINQAQRRYMVAEYETRGFIPTRHFADEFDTSLLTIRRALHNEGLRF